jgi:xanthosine utilization system XapX-like protein
MMLMMALMMGLCMGVFLLFALIPVVGWPAGLALALVGGAAMLAGHQWLMRRMCR